MSNFSVKDQTKTAGCATVWVLWLAVIAVVLCACSGVGYLVYLKTLGTATENAKTNIVRQTNQYLTTKETQVTQYITDYTKLNAEMTDTSDPAALRAQQNAIVAQIWQAVSTIPQDRLQQLEATNPGIASFLSQHPQGEVR